MKKISILVVLVILVSFHIKTIEPATNSCYQQCSVSCVHVDPRIVKDCHNTCRTECSLSGNFRTNPGYPVRELGGGIDNCDPECVVGGIW
ncbi:hypothetical protein ACHQM5_022298 [Ranunculus cassubicifolius]